MATVAEAVIVAPEEEEEESAAVLTRASSSDGMMDHELLSKEEERAHAEEILTLGRWQRAREVRKAELGREPTDEEWADAVGCAGAKQLWRQLHRSQAAREALVEGNLRLVAWVVQREVGKRASGASIPDLVQEGVVGLVTAADRFQPSRGRFSTYAFWWIRAAVLAALAAAGAAGAAGGRAPDKALLRASAELEAEHGRPPSLDELRTALGRPALRAATVERNVQLATTRAAAALPSSLDAPAFASGDGGVTLLDRLAQLGGAGVEGGTNGAEHRMLRASLRECLRRTLAPRSAWLVEARYGLGDDGVPPLSASEAAAALGVSATRVRQLEAAAFAKLRHSPEARELRSLLRWQVDADAPPVFDI